MFRKFGTYHILISISHIDYIAIHCEENVCGKRPNELIKKHTMIAYRRPNNPVHMLEGSKINTDRPVKYNISQILYTCQGYPGYSMGLPKISRVTLKGMILRRNTPWLACENGFLWGVHCLIWIRIHVQICRIITTVDISIHLCLILWLVHWMKYNLEK